MSGTVGIPGVLSASAGPGALSASALGASFGVGLPSVANAIDASAAAAPSAADDATMVMPSDPAAVAPADDGSAAAVMTDDGSAAQAATAEGDGSGASFVMGVGLPRIPAVPSLVSWAPPATAGMYTGLWILAALAGIIALVALIVAVLAYVGQSNSACGKKKCCEMKRDVRALKQGFLAQQTLLGMWSYTSDTLTGSVAATPMLFSAATPLPDAPAVDAQEGTSSVLNMPCADALSSVIMQLSDVPTAGSVTVTVTVNGAATPLTATVTSAATEPFGLGTLPTPLKVKKGDLVGLSFTASALDLSAPPVITAQLFRANQLCLL